MFHFFIRVQTATLFSICLADSLTPKTETYGGFQTKPNTRNYSSENISLRHEIPKYKDLVENISQFVHWKMNNNEENKKNLDEFTLTKKKAFVPLFVPNTEIETDKKYVVEYENEKFKIRNLEGLPSSRTIELFIPTTPSTTSTSTMKAFKSLRMGAEESDMEYENPQVRVLKKYMDYEFSTTKHFTPKKNSYKPQEITAIESDHFDMDYGSPEKHILKNTDSLKDSILARKKFLVRHYKSTKKNEIDNSNMNRHKSYGQKYIPARKTQIGTDQSYNKMRSKHLKEMKKLDRLYEARMKKYVRTHAPKRTTDIGTDKLHMDYESFAPKYVPKPRASFETDKSNTDYENPKVFKVVEKRDSLTKTKRFGFEYTPSRKREVNKEKSIHFKYLKNIGNDIVDTVNLDQLLITRTTDLNKQYTQIENTDIGTDKSSMDYENFKDMEIVNSLYKTGSTNFDLNYTPNARKAAVGIDPSIKPYDTLNEDVVKTLEMLDQMSMDRKKLNDTANTETTTLETNGSRNEFENLKRNVLKNIGRLNRLSIAKKKHAPAPNAAAGEMIKTGEPNLDNKDQKLKYLKILERESQIINILRKQTELLEQVADVLDNKENIRSKNDFDNLLSDLEKKKQAIDKDNNMTQTDVDSFNGKEITTAKNIKKRKLPTIKTIIDETEVRNALKNDPYVQRVLKMANRKREQYVRDAQKYFSF